MVAEIFHYHWNDFRAENGTTTDFLLENQTEFKNLSALSYAEMKKKINYFDNLWMMSTEGALNRLLPWVKWLKTD